MTEKNACKKLVQDMQSKYPQQELKLFDAGKNLGFSGGNNVVIKYFLELFCYHALRLSYKSSMALTISFILSLIPVRIIFKSLILLYCAIFFKGAYIFGHYCIKREL